MRFETVIRSSLDSNSNALGLTLLAEHDGLGHRSRVVSGERVVQIAHEEVLVVRVQRHEGAAHHDELHLVHGVSQSPQLIHAAARLTEGVVPGAHRSHGRGLVAGVGLRAVLEVAVRAAGAVHAHLARQRDVWAAVRLAHHRHHCDAGRGADRLGFHVWQ